MKLKSLKIISLLVASFIGISSFTIPAFAEPGEPIDPCSSELPQTVREANGCEGSEDKLPSVVQAILNTVIGITGLVAVIFIIIGGIQYMTSTGDPNKIKKAKDTILYAVIGLAVVILAFVIVNWTIEAVWKSATGGEPAPEPVTLQAPQNYRIG
ncbi:hypothetical protein IKF73_02220 [Candidatus Saccharibacteria bacterium]|nr:hypothetical protein [Candidatus Saccharibacteria bacterium]